MLLQKIDLHTQNIVISDFRYVSCIMVYTEKKESVYPNNHPHLYTLTHTGYFKINSIHLNKNILPTTEFLY